MPFVKTIRGKTNGIVLDVMMPDEATDKEKLDFLHNMQEIVDDYDNKEEFLAALENAAAKLGQKVEESN